MADQAGKTPFSRRRARRWTVQSMLRRLDFAARRSNPVLMLIVIGLVVLNLSCFAALRLAHLPLSAPHLLGGTPAAAKAPLSLSR